MTTEPYDPAWYGEPMYRSMIETDWPHTQRAGAAMVALLGIPERHLDVGCGAGMLVEFMGRLCHSEGVDLNLAALHAALEVAGIRHLYADNVATLWFAAEGDGYRKGGLHEHDLREPLAALTGESYDLVTCWEVAEHLPSEDEGLLIESCLRHLAPGGWLVWTAAQTNQPSDIHINLHPKAYWRELIPERAGVLGLDLDYDDEKTRFLATVWDHTVNPLLHLGWNVLVFRRSP